MLCSALGRLTLKAWVALPLLCVGSAVGIAALLELLVSSTPVLRSELTLSAPLLFGFAGALTYLGSSQVRWTSDRQRRWLRPGYPLAVLAAGLAVDALEIPLVVALGVGSVAIAVLVVVLVRGSTRQVPCP